MYSYLFINFPISYDECLLQGTFETENDSVIMDVVLENIKNEIVKKQGYLLNVETIYISSGITNKLSYDHWKFLLELLQPIAANVKEYNIEIHGRIDQDISELWKLHKVNRLIWKIGSFNDDLLKANSCQHYGNYQEDIKLTTAQGFSNQGVDLLYNLKHQTKALIINDINIVSSLPVEHLSYYTTESDEIMIDYGTINELLTEKKYICYEKNNFVTDAKFVAKHQESYWNLYNYLGVGRGATSFIYNSTPIVIQNNYSYPEWKAETIKLTMRDYYFGLLMMGLGVVGGMNLSLKDNRQAYEYFRKELNKLIAEKSLFLENNFLFCLPENFSNLDTLLLEFM